MKFETVDEKPKSSPAKSTTPRKEATTKISEEERDAMKKKINKMFRAACNGKGYWQRWFPDEFKDYGDFQTEFMSLVAKL